MCIAIPSGTGQRKRRSWLPAPVRVLLGSLVLVSMLPVLLVFYRLSPGR